jgi:hypothetical protein
MGTRRFKVGLLLLVVAAPVVRAEWLPATVALSDGTSIRGEVTVPNDSILIMNDAEARRYTVRTAEIARLENTVQKQNMEEKWIFKESGSDEKVYLGQYYPVRQYMTDVTFQDGHSLQGHMIAATLYVRTADGRQRYILREKQEGKVGQTLDDLVYVQSVVFGKEGAGVLGAIGGRLGLPPGEQLVKVMAVNPDKLFSVEGKFSPADGSFSIPDCTQGTYDLVVVTDKAVYLGFGIEAEKDAQRLDAEAVEDIQAWVNTLRDFFPSQTIAYAAGNAKRTFALVRQERRGGTTLPGLALLYRYEVWAMSKPKDQWVIDKRLYVWRSPSRDAALEALRTVVNPALGGLAISAETPNVKLGLKLAAQSEPPIPPHKPVKETADVHGPTQ